MALKGDRYEAATDISFFMSAAATRGGIVSYSTSGSGVALDQGDAVVAYAAVASGNVPLGLLLNDVVDIDLTRQHINWHKDSQSNQVNLNDPSGGNSAHPPVGEFMSSVDEDGYYKVRINLPQRLDGVGVAL